MGSLGYASWGLAVTEAQINRRPRPSAMRPQHRTFRCSTALHVPSFVSCNRQSSRALNTTPGQVLGVCRQVQIAQPRSKAREGLTAALE